jgi:protein phosphatase
MKLTAHGATHVGLVRERNEDAFLVDEAQMTFAVADGVGGMPGGMAASLAAIDSLRASLSKRAPENVEEVNTIVLQAHAAVGAAGQKFAPKYIATTFTMMRLIPRKLFLGHVGDSFLFRVRDGVCQALTKEHNVGNEQPDFLASAPFPPVHRNALTRVLGQLEPLTVDVAESDLSSEDVLILATDGLTNMVGRETVANICRIDFEPASIADKLIDAALRNGGRDNVTVVVVRIDET